MPSLLRLFLCGLLLASPADVQRTRRPPSAQKKAIDALQVQEDFDPEKFAGNWFLIAVASRCPYLAENHHRLEAINAVVSVLHGPSSEKSLAVNTFRPLDGHCWNITQTYVPSGIRGRFHIIGRGPTVEAAVGETDYSAYAVLFLQKGQRISAKLYGRSANVGDAVMAKYKRRVAELGMDEDFIYYYPVYGFCNKADSFHTLDESE
ncbi:complement component C8 gamma chain [Sceloporus undulatus]|uniref:complement component C8 gamma chain n=1 Tax=Sceloporus undulatus TaxID=8520 RepID=UPI001C4D8466|nr:complement component C8 gamma chain [Sceloporus undulatus]